MASVLSALKNILPLPARFALAAAACAAPARGDDGYYLYHRYDYGSQAALNPVSFFINGSYDMLQTRAMTNRVARLDYGNSMRNVADNLLHPFSAIDAYGWGDFAGTELFPSSPTLNNSQWVPNYTLHLVGGGLTFRTLKEWYQSRGAAHPWMLAGINCLLYQYMNESIENGSNKSTNVDAIADYLVFNPLGMLLFSNDQVARFFGETLNGANWGSMPLINTRTGQLDDASESFAFKYFPLRDKPLGLFYYTGLNTVFGLSWRAGEYALSAGGGIGTVGIVDINPVDGARKSTAVLGKTAALFWDRNNSLLASLILSNQRLYTVRLNVYPLPTEARWPVKPGFFAARGYDGDNFFGLALNVAPVGLSYFFR
jgi:hypothetical protein